MFCYCIIHTYNVKGLYILYILYNSIYYRNLLLKLLFVIIEREGRDAFVFQC